MEASSQRGISAAVLKNVAVITMTIDHVTAFILKKYLQSQGIMNYYNNFWYACGRDIGRIAFVLYAFMIAEGAYRTKDKAKYALRLFILALISIVPHCYCNLGKPFDPKDVNIFFLLLLGLLTLYTWDWLEVHIQNRKLSVLLRLLLIAASCTISEVLRMEYGLMGILLIVVFYVYRYNFPKLVVAGALVMTVGYVAHVVAYNGPITWINSHSNRLLQSLINSDRIQVFGILAFPFIYFYNGQKGRQLSKWFYYLYYPVHLGLIALVMELLF